MLKQVLFCINAPALVADLEGWPGNSQIHFLTPMPFFYSTAIIFYDM